jgi:hypothetical protein
MAQRTLALWNKRRMSPGFPGIAWQEEAKEDARMLRAEGAFMEEMRASVARHLADVPSSPEAFMHWFESLKEHGPGQGDPLFPWLAGHASRDQLRWFFEQEAAGEAGFDDLVALTQVKLPQRAKLELARNYWDEMGRGNAMAMHGPLLHAVADALAVKPSIENTVWESLALANAMTAMAMNRRFRWHSVGALGAIEMTAPTRAGHVAAGLKRVGLNHKERRYFELHSVLDVKHSQAWNEEAIRPLVAEDPRRALAIAEGALIRLECGRRCFRRYRRQFEDASGALALQ